MFLHIDIINKGLKYIVTGNLRIIKKKSRELFNKSIILNIRNTITVHGKKLNQASMRVQVFLLTVNAINMELAYLYSYKRSANFVRKLMRK